MVKEPRAGRVKTRLGRDIGMSAAAWWYRHQTARLLRRLADPRWRIVLAVAPDIALRARAWPAGPARMPQGRGGLGQRMVRAIAATPGPTVLIGSDIPAVGRHHIAEAFRVLGGHASVIGPAEDGGFWLVGLAHPRRAPRRMFEGVRWSRSETLREALMTLPQPVAFAARLADVDEAADLRD